MTGEVHAYLDAVASQNRRRDAYTLVELMKNITGEQPRVWGSIVGFGQYHYRYDSGREGDAPAAAFAARKGASTVYLPDGVGGYRDLLEQLGPHSTGVGCIYIKDVRAIDLDVLAEIVARLYGTLTRGTFRNRARDASEE